MNSDDIFDGIDDREPPRRRRKGWWIAGGLVMVLILGVGLAVGGYLMALRGAYEKTNTVAITREEGEKPEAGEGTNYLLLGSDKRSEDEAESSGVTGQRSDVMMLVHVSADRDEVYVISFPRDLYVEIPGQGTDRINAALAYGGLPLAVATVEDYTGVPIDHVALIDFDGIEGLVDALGGVEVQVPTDFEGDGVQFHQGPQEMNGEEALIFARQRYQFADGDFQRNRNQQALLHGIIGELLSRDTLTSPTTVLDTVEKISPYMTVDDALTASTMAELGWGLRDVRSGDISYLSVPHGGPTTTSGGASVVATDEEQMDVLRQALREDTMDVYYRDHRGMY
ncbi:MAG: LCP family protein [Brachybacterium sp.]|nr:LCP family protein [Brachybacterium sp.]